MIKLNKKIEYALMALKYMADKDGDDLTTARELCDHFSTPFDTMAKVLQIMNQNNILTSVKGINGGYAIEKNIATVSFHEFTKMIDGGTDHFCQKNKGLCELYGTCNIVTPMENLNQKIKQYLETITLKDLLTTNTIHNIAERA